MNEKIESYKKLMIFTENIYFREGIKHLISQEKIIIGSPGSLFSIVDIKDKILFIDIDFIFGELINKNKTTELLMKRNKEFTLVIFNNHTEEVITEIFLPESKKISQKKFLGGCFSKKIFIEKNEKKSQRLTPRQYQITNLMLSGMSCGEVSLMLGISEKTINHHLQSALKKAGIRKISHFFIPPTHGFSSHHMKNKIN